MENASKALMLSAGVLVGILILTLAGYLFSIFGDYASQIQKEVTENQLVQFNQKYLKYHNLDNLTIQDIITVKNYALENNFSYFDYNFGQRALPNNYFIDVYVNNIWILQHPDERLLKNEIKNYSSNHTYSCQVEINENTGKVCNIYFTPN